MFQLTNLSIEIKWDSEFRTHLRLVFFFNNFNNNLKLQICLFSYYSYFLKVFKIIISSNNFQP